MKTLRISTLLLLLFTAVLVFVPARAKAEVSFDFFYDNLSPYGEWVDVGDYGMCWRPTGVDADWAPYTDGYWAYTDAGWTWVSYEEFGGIVYHYGRWVRLEDEGWCWVPESEWAPAWVSWRTSDDYVGWAPLPPEAGWRRDVGIGIWSDNAYGVGPGYYSFCHTRDFGAPVLRGVIVDRGENITIIRGTVNVTNITYNTGFSGGPVIFNGGPRFESVSRVSSHPIPTLKLVTNANLDPASWHNHRGPGGINPIAARTVGNQLIVAAPQVAAPADMAAFKSHAKKVIPAGKISKGWGVVKDPKVQQELKQEIQRQAKGLTPASAPARPVAAADLKVLPEKVDPHAAPVGGSHEKSGNGRRPEGLVGQPNNEPPRNPSSSPVAKPSGPKPSAPVANNPALKPFNGEPSQKPAVQNPPTSKGSAAAENAQQEQSRIRAEQEKQEKITQQKQFGSQQEAAKAEEARRHAIESQQQQQEQRATDPRRGPSPDKEKERGRPPVETERGGGSPQPHGNAPSSSPTTGGAHHSKDGKDSKDKDKDKNGN